MNKASDMLLDPRHEEVRDPEAQEEVTGPLLLLRVETTHSLSKRNGEEGGRGSPTPTPNPSCCVRSSGTV